MRVSNLLLAVSPLVRWKGLDVRTHDLDIVSTPDSLRAKPVSPSRKQSRRPFRYSAFSTGCKSIESKITTRETQDITHETQDSDKMKTQTRQTHEKEKTHLVQFMQPFRQLLNLVMAYRFGFLELVLQSVTVLMHHVSSFFSWVGTK